MAPTVLVTGASGLLGRDVAKSFEFAHWRVVGTGLTRTNPPSIVKLDLLNEEEIKRVLDEEKPSVIVHCAANRFPDSCTSDPEGARAINVSSTRTLAAEAYKRSILLIYISTDYVFSGKAGEAPYTTSSATGPTNVYGQTKCEGEQVVLKETAGSVDDKPVLGVILRVPVLYGHCEADDKSNSAIHAIVDAVRKAGKVKEGEAKIKVDDYGIRYPTATEDVGRVCVDIAKLYIHEGNSEGHAKLPRVLHFSSNDKYTKYEMAKVFAQEILGVPIENLEAWDPTKDDDKSNSTTVRPYNTHLDTSALKDLGIDTSSLNFIAWW